MTQAVLGSPVGRVHRRFADESRWIVKRHIPVFKEHTEYELDEESPDYGKVIDQFGPAELREIVDNCNKRYRQTGDACPLTLGHTRKGRPESEQPEIVGYAINFKLEPGADGKQWIFCDFFFYPHLDVDGEGGLLEQYPRRSVELFPKENVFDPIALLRRTPELDLGLTLDYAKRSEPKQYAKLARQHLQRYVAKPRLIGTRVIRFQMADTPLIGGEVMDPELDPNAAPAAPAAPPAPPPEQFDALPPDPNDPSLDPEGELPEEHQYTADRYWKHFMRKYAKLKKFCMEEGDGGEDPEKFEAAAPGSSNVAVPGMPGDPPPAQFAKRGQSRVPATGRDDGNSIHYAKRLDAAEKRLAAAERELAAERVAKKLAQGEHFVTRLEGEGFNFKSRRDHWVKQFAKAADAERCEFVQEIRDNWQRDGAPTGDFIPTAQDSDPEAVLAFNKRGQAKQFGKAERARAIEMVEQSGGKLSYEQAVEAVKNGKAV